MCEFGCFQISNAIKFVILICTNLCRYVWSPENFLHFVELKITNLLSYVMVYSWPFSLLCVYFLILIKTQLKLGPFTLFCIAYMLFEPPLCYSPYLLLFFYNNLSPYWRLVENFGVPWLARSLLRAKVESPQGNV